MRSILLTVAYEGSAYAGWQVQPGRKTIQAELEMALEAMTGERIRVIGSGRTDAGVHALGQVAGFQTESALAPAVFVRALNARLPRDIAVLEAREAAPDFHPIRDALVKRYRYIIHDGPIRDVFSLRHCWYYGRPLDAAKMAEAARNLVGRHDFSSFQTSGAERLDSIRTISDLSVERGCGPRQQRVVVEVEADGFLYNMVRAIVGTLVEVGRGARSAAWVTEVLAAADRNAGGPTAPAQGLFLVSVQYPEHVYRQ